MTQNIENLKPLQEGQFHAWYSAKQDKSGGASLYKLHDTGEEVLVTEVNGGTIPNWDDSEYRGIVTYAGWLRRVSYGRGPRCLDVMESCGGFMRGGHR